MKNHLNSKHGIEIVDIEKADSQQKIQRTMDHFVVPEKESLQQIVSKLTSIEGFSLNKIKTSDFIRKAVAREGYSLPLSENTLRKLVLDDAVENKQKLKAMFEEKLKQNQRFSLTLDEWTSIRNRRYVNINVHDADSHYNLGLVRAVGSITSERTIEIVRDKCHSFGLELSFDTNTSEHRQQHIVAATTDGASVMVRFGKLLDEEHVMCYAHALHLAVQDVLYKRGTDLLVDYVDTGRSESDSETEHGDDNSYSEDDDEGDEDLVEDNEVNELRGNVKYLIDRVRKVVKQVRRSPLKNDKLQEYTRREFGK